jgi:hypothetical protein
MMTRFMLLALLSMGHNELLHLTVRYGTRS